MESRLKQKRVKLHKRKWFWPVFFLAPYVILYLAFSLFPIVHSFIISLFDWKVLGESVFVGFKNYIDLLTSDRFFLKSLGNTLLLMAMYIPASILAALLLSNLIYSKGVRFKRFFQVSYFLPNVTTSVAVGLMFALIFDWQTGILNNLLVNLGLIGEGVNWLGQPGTARFVTALMLFWGYFGYCNVFYLAGLSAIPEELYEAARLDGASGWQTLRRITIPMLRPTTRFLIITSIISGSQVVEEPMLLLNGWASVGQAVGGPDRSCLTAVWYLYDVAFGRNSNMEYSKGAAIGYLTFIFILLVVGAWQLASKLIAKRRGEVADDA